MKRLLSIVVTIMMSMSMLLNVQAATGTVKKTGDYSKIEFKYTSYITSKGIKAVSGGKVISTKGLYRFFWQSWAENKKVKLIDGGRTYLVKVSGHVAFGVNSTYKSFTDSYEFYYRKKY